MKRLRPAILSLLLLITLAMSSGSLAAQDTVANSAAPFRFRLASWETRALLESGAAQLRRQFQPSLGLRAEDTELVKRYFTLAQQANMLREELGKAAATRQDASGIEQQLAALEHQQGILESAVERTIAVQLTQALRQEGLGRGPRRRILFPPVLFKLDPLPALLAVSPRERIELKESHLLQPGLLILARERVEGQQARLGLSSLVTDIGGLATYPSQVPNSFGLDFALATVAHEWLHQYLAFQSLGKGYFAGGEMTSLNETVAALFGDELGARLYYELYGGPPPTPSHREAGAAAKPEPGAFDFTREMRQTRLRAEELLGEGRVAEAEAYMEERRQLFLAQGYYLRKLNQAYFAFHGSYAEGPASISPLGRQVRLIRERSSGLGDFVHTVERFGRFEEFQAYLRAQGLAPAGATGP
ncbi:MAG: hypothetical protein HY330_06955 [Chloroflexi bacterium]|nr:hypothetical protein [Chloroflexota bacterium]